MRNGWWRGRDVAVGVVLGAAIVATVGLAGGSDVPICEEDEVVTSAGLCIAMDDAAYVGGEGWVLR